MWGAVTQGAVHANRITEEESLVQYLPRRKGGKGLLQPVSIGLHQAVIKRSTAPRRLRGQPGNDVPGEGADAASVLAHDEGVDRPRAEPADRAVRLADSADRALAAPSRNNPTLRAARARHLAAEKDVSAAKGGWYPKLNLTGGVARNNTSGQITLFPGPPFSASLDQSSVALRVDQPIWQGGTLSSQVDAAEDRASAVHADTRARESAVLLSAVRAYLGVVTAQAVLSVQVHNVATLQRQLDAARQSLAHGEGTRTDVAQAKSRYEGAVAARIQAQAALARARADYATVIGSPPDGSLALPRRFPQLPATLQQAEALSGENYSVTAARFNAQAAHAEAAGAQGKLLPKIGLYAEMIRNENPQYGFARVTDRVVGLSIDVPIWQGGTVHAQAAAARDRARRGPSLGPLDRDGRLVPPPKRSVWGVPLFLYRELFDSVDIREHLKRRRTYPGIFPVLHLDHIYYEGNVQVRSVELPRTRKALIASDHLPLVANLRGTF